MTKILIADDHAIVREGLKQIVAETSDMQVVAEAGTGSEVLRKVADVAVDVVVLDISMPELNGLDVLKELRKTRPDIPVLVLSIHPEEQYASRALRAGAAGYLTKESAPEELIAALRRLSQGRKYISTSVAERLALELERNSDKPPHQELSDREFQVLRLIGSGKAAKDIAAELGLSVKTISTYRARILQKMHLKNNSEITHYAIKHHLVE